MKKLIAILSLVALPMMLSAQAKKPTLIVVPGDAWCAANGYMTEFDNQGKVTRVPDYERALVEDMDLVNVITKINELMADRGFTVKDLSQSVKNISQTTAENEMTTSRTSGASIAETPLDRLLNRAKADIMLEVNWKTTDQGPKKYLTYNLRGLDAYTSKQVAASQGTGEPSFSAVVPVLLEEAVLKNMDNFCAQLQAHFDDMVANGREVIVNLRIFDNGSGMSFEDEFDGVELSEIIDDWMAQNTVNHRYSLLDATEDYMSFEQVRIPLYRNNDMPMDTRHFVTLLRNFLKKAPYNIPSKLVTKGLGRAELILGEK